MGRILLSTKAKRSFSSGFTLLEMLVVLLILSLCALITPPLKFSESGKYEKEKMVSAYAMTQSDAMLYHNETPFEYEGIFSSYEIYFNGKGNVNMAQTISFENEKEFVIWLGSGRIHENKERLYPD